MACFYTGDELGNVKRILSSRSNEDGSWAFNDKIIYSLVERDETEFKPIRKVIQRLSLDNEGQDALLATASSSAEVQILSLDDGPVAACCLSKSTENRMSLRDTFVGLQLKSNSVFWCASNGAAGARKLRGPEEDIEMPTLMSLPTRLRAWQLSDDARSFAYGGDEVDLSVWDCERAMQGTGTTSLQDTTLWTKKRKRDAQLFPAEIWRAKNLPNDHLNLRQPINITTLTHFRSHGTVVSHLLASGTHEGQVRRYDTRAAKKPVANFSNLGLTGPISNVCSGSNDHELFVSDSGTSLCALDTRNGQKIYAYKKMQGSVTSMCPADGQFLGSTSRDRYFRIHSTFPPSVIAGRNQEERGEVLGSLFMKSIPTTVVADDTFVPINSTRERDSDEDEHDGDEIWDDLEDADSGDGLVEQRSPRRRKIKN